MNEIYADMERVFLALSDKTRIKLVGLMRDGEVSVNYLCGALNESQPKVSRHLAYLRSMHVVNARREGKWIFYSLAEPESGFGSRLLQDVLSWIVSLDKRSDIQKSPMREQRDRAETAVQVIRDDKAFDTYGYADMNESHNELEVYLL